MHIIKRKKWYTYLFEDVESNGDIFKLVTLTGLPETATGLPYFMVINLFLQMYADYKA